MEIENVLDENVSVVLTDENGYEEEFDFLDGLEYKKQLYAILLSKSQEVVILRMKQGEDGDTFEGIEDESELQEVFEKFKNRVDGE